MWFSVQVCFRVFFSKCLPSAMDCTPPCSDGEQSDTAALVTPNRYLFATYLHLTSLALGVDGRWRTAHSQRWSLSHFLYHATTIFIACLLYWYPECKIPGCDMTGWLINRKSSVMYWSCATLKALKISNQKFNSGRKTLSKFRSGINKKNKEFYLCKRTPL